MENKCKNCICYHPSSFGDGSKGTCGQSGELLVHDREHFCDCAMFIELPRKEKIKRTIEKVLKPWIRERDPKFKRALELVGHIGSLFEQGEFKTFDVVKSASEMKSLVFHGKEVINEVDIVWTYHCPWDDEREHYILLTEDNKMVMNCWTGDKFITNWFNCDEEFDTCMENIDKVRQHCITGYHTADAVVETEDCKCVTDSVEEQREAKLENQLIRYPR